MLSTENVLGDHGFQRAEDPITFTEQGRIENNLPAFYLFPPSNLHTTHPNFSQNIKNNARKLTSFWDINQTLRQILSMSIHRPTKELFKNHENHGESLLENIGNRNCAEAEIPDNYCQCTDAVSDLPSHVAATWTRGIISDINNFLQDYDYCQKLTYSTVMPPASYKSTNHDIFIRIQFQVSQGGPKGGIFESSWSWDMNSEIIFNEKIVRLDWYSDTSGCVPSDMAFIRSFCICP